MQGHQGKAISVVRSLERIVADQGSISQWIAGVRDGDSQALNEVWRRYYQRLVGLARQKLKDAPRRVADEEDVVVEAFNSFCGGAAAGRFPKLQDRDDLWQVLMMLTARKAANQRKHDFRLKRGGGRVRGESAFLQVGSTEERAAIEQVVGSAPTPEFADNLVAQCEDLLSQLEDETLQRIAIAKLNGYSNDEIAKDLDVQTRTVERKLRVIRTIWTASSSS